MLAYVIGKYQLLDWCLTSHFSFTFHYVLAMFPLSMLMQMQHKVRATLAWHVRLLINSEVCNLFSEIKLLMLQAMGLSSEMACRKHYHYLP